MVGNAFISSSENWLGSQPHHTVASRSCIFICEMELFLFLPTFHGRTSVKIKSHKNKLNSILCFSNARCELLLCLPHPCLLPSYTRSSQVTSLLDYFDGQLLCLDTTSNQWKHGFYPMASRGNILLWSAGFLSYSVRTYVLTFLSITPWPHLSCTISENPSSP